MAISLTLQQLITEILNRSKQNEICVDFQNIMLATSYSEILQAGTKFPVWVWSTGIMDSNLLNEFPQIDLVNAGIYNQNTTISNPITETIYILPNSTVTVNLSGTHKTEIINLGGVLNINCIGNSFVKIKSYYNSQINANMNDNSIACIGLNNNSNLTFEAFLNSNSNIVCSDNSLTNVTLNNTSFLNIRLNEDAILNYQTLDTSQIKITKFNNSQSNEIGTPI